MINNKKWLNFFCDRVIWICLTLILCFSSLGQTSTIKNQWYSNGPWGDDRFNVIIDPVDNQKLYVLGGAIHTSTDGGEQWQAIMNTSIPNKGLYPYSMAINPQDPDEMVVGTLFDGVWKSFNAGAIWEPINDSLPDSDRGIRSLLMDISDPKIIYSGILNPSGNAQAAVYRSIDGGYTWTPFDQGIPKPYTQVTCIFQNPLNAELFVGTFGDGIFRYSYAQEKWIAVNSGLTLPQGLFITDIAFDPADEQVMYACTKKDWVYKSVDGGQTWQQLIFPEQLNTDYPPMAYYLRIDPNNSNVIWIGALPGSGWPNESIFYRAEPDQDIGGLFLSTDNGEKWHKVLPDFGGFRLTIDPSETTGEYPDIKSKVMYLTSGGVMGVLKSEDGGNSFQNNIEGINGTWINSLLQHPVDDSKIFASAEAGQFFSFDAGLTWSLFRPSQNDRVVYTWSMAIDPNDSNKLYYATGDPAWVWQENKGLYVIDITKLDPNEDINYVSGELVASTEGIGIWKVYLFENSTIYLATQDQGILKSDDHGQSWHELNDGLNEMSVACITFDENGTPLYAGTRTGNGNPYWTAQLEEKGALYKWIPESNQWSRVGVSEITTAVFDIVTLPGNQDVIYVGTVDSLFLSNDNGITWAKKDVGLPEHFFTSDIEIDVNNNDRIFISSWYHGIYVSVDGGDHWNIFNEKLTHHFVQDIVMDWAKPDVLYAGTLGGGVFQCVTGNEPVIDTVVGNGFNLTDPYTISVKETELVTLRVDAIDADPEDSLTYFAYYNGMKILAQAEPGAPYSFDPISHTFQWTPSYGMAGQEPYSIVFVISDGVFSIQIKVDIIVEPAETVYSPTLDITLNKTDYYKDDWMELYASVTNPDSPCEVDVYIALGTQEDPYFKYYPNRSKVQLPHGLDVKDVTLVRYQMVDFPVNTYILTGIMVPLGGDVTNKEIWLTSSSISFTFNE